MANYRESKQDALARIREAEQRSAQAMRRFVGRAVRLSELGNLPRSEFDALLALMDAALRSPAQPGESRRALALGQYMVTLTVSPDQASSTIETDHGRFTSPDFTIEVAARESAPRYLRKAS